MEKYLEKAREIPVRGQYDVIVAGGGTAGFAAAIAAARKGAKTLVVERMNCLGGQITAGMMGIFQAINDQQKEVVRGLALEFLNELWDRGGVNKRDMHYNLVEERDFSKKQWANYDPEAAKLLINDWILREKNLTVLFESWVADAIVEDNKVKGIIVENKSGRSAYYGKCVVDASADADVCVFAGGECSQIDKNDLHPVTLISHIGGINKEPFFEFYNAHPDWRDTFPTTREWAPGAFHKLGIDNELIGVELPPELEYLRHWCIILHDTPLPNKMQLNMTGEAQVDGTDAEALSRAIITSRKRIAECLSVMRKVVPGWENAYILMTASILGVRETRQIVGDYTLTEEDLLACKRYEDSICTMYGGIGVHTGDGQWVEFITPPPGNNFDIPLSAMLPKGLDGIIVAGRCVSATHLAMGSIRPISGCMGMGEGAGIAAALAVELGVEPRDLPKDKLQETLLAQGVYLEGRSK